MPSRLYPFLAGCILLTSFNLIGSASQFLAKKSKQNLYSTNRPTGLIFVPKEKHQFSLWDINHWASLTTCQLGWLFPTEWENNPFMFQTTNQVITPDTPMAPMAPRPYSTLCTWHWHSRSGPNHCRSKSTTWRRVAPMSGGEVPFGAWWGVLGALRRSMDWKQHINGLKDGFKMV